MRRCLVCGRLLRKMHRLYALNPGMADVTRTSLKVICHSANGGTGLLRQKNFAQNIRLVYNMVTVQQVCAYTALTVRKSSGNKHKSITEGDFAWICARNYEGTE